MGFKEDSVMQSPVETEGMGMRCSPQIDLGPRPALRLVLSCQSVCKLRVRLCHRC